MHHALFNVTQCKGTPMGEWVLVQEGSLLWCPYAQGILVQRCLLNSSWLLRGSASLFAIPSFMFKYAFHADLLTSFGQSHMRWLGLLHLKQFLFFFWYNSTTLAKQAMCLMDWSASFTLPDTSTSSSVEYSVSSSPSCSTPGSSSATSFPTVTDQMAVVWLPFSLHEGNRFPGV